ncbi:MAG: 5-methyltetrahydropteroyltriglutamate--homocysteine S-methyltransferase [Hyphomicrobiaceae bacterium]|nr:5-methyltetrahydropteroyltriglutamate--homocysteine S-methyltransferase [Hyphomicrobiaceae bacterium]
MSDTTAPYRADEVGSLLRTAPLKEARARRAKGEITPAQLKAVEDEEIRKILRKQEEIGLKLATDGEFRRTWWQFDFFEGLGGVEIYDAERGIQFKGIETAPRALRVTGKLDFPADHPMLEHFRFLAANTLVTPKMTIPAPANLHFRNGRKSISRQVYPDLASFFDDLAMVYGKVIRAFYDAGCRYLQLDDTSWGYLCSAQERALAKTRGDDNVDELPAVYAELTNRALKSKPSDMVVTTHVCRGNFRSHWISEGGYEPVAELLLGGVNYDGYFMEWDTERAGGLEPLRFLPKGSKRVVVGLITSKTGALETKDYIKRRLDVAAKHAPLGQLCLSPQCGFASTEEGNILTEDEQWAKLGLVVDVAREVWGP